MGFVGTFFICLFGFLLWVLCFVVFFVCLVHSFPICKLTLWCYLHLSCTELKAFGAASWKVGFLLQPFRNRLIFIPLLLRYFRIQALRFWCALQNEMRTWVIPGLGGKLIPVPAGASWDPGTWLSLLCLGRLFSFEIVV